MYIKKILYQKTNLFLKTVKKIEDYNERVLGMQRDPKGEAFKFKVHLNFSRKRRRIHISPELSLEQLNIETSATLTKRMVPSQINRFCDSMGLTAVFTIRAKIMMRKL